MRCLGESERESIDENNNPVAKAKIVIKQGNNSGKELLTNKDGMFIVNENLCPMPGCSSEVRIEVRKDGYQSFEKILTAEEINGKQSLSVILKKE